MSTVLLFDDLPLHQTELKNGIDKFTANDTCELFDDTKPLEKERSYEQHIEYQILDKYGVGKLGLIACDKELGQYKNYPGLSANAVSRVARNLGVPFCQYSRNSGVGAKDLARFQQLRRWNAEEITLGGADISEWSQEIAMLFIGFERIKDEYKNEVVQKLKPSAALAKIMGRQDAESRLSLYGSGDQSVMSEIFGYLDEQDKQSIVVRMPRIIGTWLFLSILRFPGILVNEIAAASFLNISVDDFRNPDNQSEFDSAKYEGPFNELEKRWWREDLENMLLDSEVEDGLKYLEAKGKTNLSGCDDAQTNEQAGYYCMLTETPVARKNSTGNINWFPSGADLSRIRNDKFDEITSLVSF